MCECCFSFSATACFMFAGNLFLPVSMRKSHILSFLSTALAVESPNTVCTHSLMGSLGLWNCLSVICCVSFVTIGALKCFAWSDSNSFSIHERRYQSENCSPVVSSCSLGLSASAQLLLCVNSLWTDSVLVHREKWEEISLPSTLGFVLKIISVPEL